MCLAFCALLYDEIMAVNVKSLNRDQTSSLYAFLRMTVQAVSATRLWGLPSIRFTELCNRQPTVAVALAMAAGSVLSKRLGNRKRRVATT